MGDSRDTEPMRPSDSPNSWATDATRTRAPEPSTGDETRVRGDTPLVGAPAVSDAPSATVGERYQLGPVLARGGMGVVYQAEDRALEREVALKVLRPELVGTSAVERFRAEVHVTGQLQHPSIPPVHDIGALPDGRPFMAMKLIKGRTLADEIRARPFDGTDLDGLAAVFERVCLAVAFAHSRGWIHRDLKPANIMVGAFGEVQVMDWGLAKHVNRAAQRSAGEPVATPVVLSAGDHADPDDRTEVGEILGTPPYMPPEQTRGAEVDERTDVFALGGILLTMLTGKPPYTGDSAREVWEKARTGAIDDARARLNAVQGAGQFRTIARRCLEPNPAQRFAHAGEVAAAVSAARAKAREVTRRDELTLATEDADRDRRRSAVRAERAVKLGIAALVVGLTVAIGAAFYVDYLHAKHTETSAARDKADAEQQRALFPVLVAAAHRRADEGAFNPGTDFDERARFVALLQRSAEPLPPTDAAHLDALVCGVCLIAADPDANAHWVRAVERYKAVTPDHTEIALAIEAANWFTRSKHPSKLDHMMRQWLKPILAPTRPIPDELRPRATAALALVEAKRP